MVRETTKAEIEKMKTVKRGGYWWITGVPDCEDCGPYHTKAEAEDDRRGMARFIKYENKKG